MEEGEMQNRVCESSVNSLQSRWDASVPFDNTHSLLQVGSSRLYTQCTRWTYYGQLLHCLSLAVRPFVVRISVLLVPMDWDPVDHCGGGRGHGHDTNIAPTFAKSRPSWRCHADKTQLDLWQPLASIIGYGIICPEVYRLYGECSSESYKGHYGS